MGSLVGLTGSCSVTCQVLLCVEADDQCLVGLNHKVNGNRGFLGIELAHQQGKLGSGVGNRGGGAVFPHLLLACSCV